MLAQSSRSKRERRPEGLFGSISSGKDQSIQQTDVEGCLKSNPWTSTQQLHLLLKGGRWDCHVIEIALEVPEVYYINDGNRIRR